MKFIDWFAGVGGFRRGMELAGHECVGFCEFDRFAVASYASMHCITDEQREYLNTLEKKQRQKEIIKGEYLNGEWYANDIKRVNAEDIPDSDCWCFGFPCQDISVAGKQRGFKGNRSSLFFRVMYLLGQLEEEKKPTFLFIENVKNLLSVNGGWDFARLLVELDKNGYDAEWTVLNSKDFGVPQNRERCFIIGHLRGRSSSNVFPVERTDSENSVHGIGHRQGYRRNTQIFDRGGITEALDTGQGGGRGHYTVIPVGNTNPSGNGINGNCYSADGINPTLTTNKGEGSKVAIPVLTPERITKRQNGRRFKEDGEESFTLTGQDRHGVAVEVEPMEMSGYCLKESEDEAHSLNCTDQRKVFGAHQTRTMVGYNVTLKRGGGVTQTANTLMARDYKGIGNQTMTTAMMCLQLTKESDPENEQKQTASQPEKTAG